MAKLSGAGVVVASLCCCVLLAVVLAGQPAAAGADGAFERTVFELVNAAIRGNGSTVEADPRIGPALIRLLFHDCWGCDGSVLLDETPADGTSTEEKAAKSIGLGGFDLIDSIKARLAAAGDGDASCADILAFAARDAATILSGGRIRYSVYRGRGDGVASSASAADAALPGPDSSFAELEESFAARGFGKGDLAALSGAHAVGVCHGPSFADRLRPSVAAAYQINGTYQLALVARRKKQLQMTNDTTTETETMTRRSGPRRATAASGALDNSYYTANLQNMVLLKSDWELTQDEDTLARLVAYRDDAAKWSEDFGEAMERLSSLRPPVGARLEIRNNCRVTNPSPLWCSRSKVSCKDVTKRSLLCSIYSTES